MDRDTFLTLHDGLPREGPGDRERFNWVVALAAVPADGVICDAGCGPGADIAGLLAHVPRGRAEALERHAGLVAAAAGYRVLGQRPLSDAAWEAYFHPMDPRIATLRAGAGAALAAVLDEAEEEIATWRACRAAYGHFLSVVRPG